MVLDAAVHHNLKCNLLIAMNTPAHDRGDAEWDAIADRVRRILSLRTKFDLVVLSDRRYAVVQGIVSSGRFPADRVREQWVSVWFSHSAITQVAVWEKFNLAQVVAYEANMM
ncbi:hypothetical protein [Streptomyces sp. NPDC050534]|uniref:hypothetical protein n=1 Tax=Streptomyces sp. NPDC050534 TaxID=3365625 RepID=UPI0037B482EB